MGEERGRNGLVSTRRTGIGSLLKKPFGSILEEPKKCLPIKKLFDLKGK